MQVKSNLDLTDYNSYRIKSVAKTVFFPEDEGEILELKRNYPNATILGGGNNIILAQEYYENEFIIIQDNYSKVEIQDTVFKAQAGISLKKLSSIALEHSLSGLEIFYDIPGTLGGAIYMNAGTHKLQISNLLNTVTYLNILSGKIVTVKRDELLFQYRQSIFQDNSNLIILSAELNLTKSLFNEILENTILNFQERHYKQPREYPNGGSVFKRPEGKYVGTMLEDLGLKGFSIGGAKISEKHAGFIINYNNATGANIIALIEHINMQVSKKYGFKLELEQKII